MPDEFLRKSQEQSQPFLQRRYYKIELRGSVKAIWLSIFDPISTSSSDRGTIIQVLTDQAGLRGIMNRLWDLNLDIISMVEISSLNNDYGGK
ncbi:MAG TPA: hypothetical protein VLM80_01365 [Anaerolineales bacterium]|nr:hypothetical protein [Anaerolineales bacterium]